jgi:hypothetical protein
MITQEKSNEELTKKAREIISSLESFNLVEKYKIVSSLYHSLLDLIKEEGIIIEEQ